MKSKILLLLLILLAFIAAKTAFAQGTAFTYQGRLDSGGASANGSYDLRFVMYDNSVGGNQQGSILTNTATAVSNGLFTVTLDFGNQFPGANRFLEIAVRTNGNGGFTTLSPRQPLTPAPYAITAGGVVSGGLSAGTYGNAVTFNNSADSFSGSFTGNGANVTNVNAATLGGLAPSSLWQLAGNNVAAGNFLGSMNNQPVEIRANNLKVMQFAYASNGVSGYSPNVIGGHSANNVAAGVVGATIGGGGLGGFFGPNAVTADFGTVVGGEGNSATGAFGTAGGGLSAASGQYSVAFGAFSLASGDYSVAMGQSTASGTNSAAFGASKATAVYSTAMGHSTANYYGTTAMGISVASNAFYATAMGNSTATGQYSTAMGVSTAGGGDSTAMGASYASADRSTAMGQSDATGSFATAMGGSFASGTSSTAMGNSTASGVSSTASGYDTVASGDYSFACGLFAEATNQGTFVWADSQPSVFTSTANNQFLVRAQGGLGLNTAAPETALHIADASGITIGTSATGGGYTALRIYLNQAQNGYAQLQAIGQAGSTYGNVILQPIAGRVGIGKNNPATELDVNGTASATTFNSTSDRNAKEKFTAVSSRDVLDKVAGLPITEWSFKQDPDTRHIGPMAQDFYAAFNVGMDDKHIATVDEGGVALAAIQGLNQKFESENATLRAENAELKTRLEKLEKLLLPGNPDSR
jgi:hypothetical protein